MDREKDNMESAAANDGYRTQGQKQLRRCYVFAERFIGRVETEIVVGFKRS
jgi:hypothetical protein